MIDIETIEVSGFKGAIYGMRNPFKNRETSDSAVYDADKDGNPIFTIGAKDLELCQKLLRAGGDDDAKFMRMIHAQADVNAPLYWWKEFDTYKVATVANSESTMHTIAQRAFTLDDFATDYLISIMEMNSMPKEKRPSLVFDFSNESSIEDAKVEICPLGILVQNMDMLNKCRELYLETKDKKYWYQMIQLLPSSYMQKRTIDLNYQTLRRIYFARRNHKLDEWHTFCDWIKYLDYGKELITYEEKAH